MKKLIALLLAIGMIVSLGACKAPGQTPEGTGASQNTETQSTAPSGTGNSSAPTDGAAEDPKPLVWTDRWVTSAFRNFHAEGTTRIYRLTYELWSSWSDLMLQRHKACFDAGTCVLLEEEKCQIGEFFSSKTYSKEYFAENTLIVVDVQGAYGKPNTIKSLTYEDNTLTLTMERPKYGNEWYEEYSVLLEIESVLPVNTQLEYVVEEYEVPKVPDGLPESIDFKWQHTTIGSELFFETSIGEKYKDVISGEKFPGTQHRFTGHAGMVISDYEAYQEIVADDAQTNLRDVEWPTYDEAYFEENCIVLFNIIANLRCRGLKDVRYQDGILTCSILVEPLPPGAFENAGPVLYYLYIIEVDTKLPEGIAIESEVVYTET